LLPEGEEAIANPTAPFHHRISKLNREEELLKRVVRRAAKIDLIFAHGVYDDLKILYSRFASKCLVNEDGEQHGCQ
jgi:hypothetical protein